jgi:hypothetical protein
MSEKKMVRRSVAIALGIICMILAVGLVGAIANYTSIINGKDNTIVTKDSQIQTLTNQKNQLKTWLTGNETLLNQAETWLNGNKTLLGQTQTWLEGNITYYNSQINSLSSQITSLQRNITLAYDSGYKAGVTSRGFDIVDPTYQQMLSFMATDTVHSHVYNSTYICWNFCNDYINEAFRAGWRCGFVYISYPEYAHGVVCFNTTDKGIVFAEPQFNEIVKVAIGLSYSRANGFIPATYNDTIVNFGIIW